MKKVLSLILVLCLVLPVVTACSSGTTATVAPATTPAAEATPTPWAFDGANYKGEVKVGVLCNLTGYGALEGEGERNGFSLAVDEWNAKGGINGYKIVAQYEDDQTTPDGALNAFSKRPLPVSWALSADQIFRRIGYN
jgi:branched-chain amino acid transport system substrate-binding protein